MPLGGVPEVEGLAAVDAHEAAALAEQALLLVSRQPQPSTALEVLMQEAEAAAAAAAAQAAGDEAAELAAAAAAADLAADGLMAASGAEAGTVHAAAGREAQVLGGMPGASAQAGVRAGSPGRPVSGRSTGERQGQGRGRSRLYSSGRALPRGGAGGVPPQGAADGDTGRLAAGITGTRLAVLPPVGYMGAPLPIPAWDRPGTADGAGAWDRVGHGAADASGVHQSRPGGSAAAAAAVAGGSARMAGEADLGQPATGLGYYPGTQVDAMGRVTDWRLSLLAPVAMPPNRRASPPRQQATRPPHGK